MFEVCPGRLVLSGFLFGLRFGLRTVVATCGVAGKQQVPRHFVPRNDKINWVRAVGHELLGTSYVLVAWPEHGDEKKCGLSSSDSDPDTLAEARATEIATNVSLENVYEFNFNGLTLRKWRPQFQSG